MSKVKLEANENGTGTVTLASPDTNTDRTIVLPDASGTLLLAGQPVASFATDSLTNVAGTGSPDFPNKLRQSFYLSPVLITASYTVPTGFNAMTAGPIEIDTGVEVEVATNSTWTVV